MVDVAAALGNDVHDRSRCLAELGFVAVGQHLEFGDAFLSELLGRSAVHGVLVRYPVNQEIVVAAPFAQHRVGAVTVRVDLAVDGDAGHELQQVEIVSSVDGQLGDLARRDGRAGRGGRRVHQG